MTSKKITSLDGLKAIAMIFLFYWHSPLPKPSADLGARLCEILFVISGFLVAYNYIDENFPATLEQSYSYTSKKFKRIWPIHFFAFALVAVNTAITDPEVLFSKKTIVSAVVNLSLLQAWSTDFFSFNGATWFISALLFCYFSSPALLYVIRKYNSKVLLVLAILIRIVLEKASVDEISVWTFNYHVSPVIRCIEFFIGMNLVPLYKSIYGIQFPNNTINDMYPDFWTHRLLN